VSRQERVYVIGAGGHAKVVLALLRELGYVVAAVFDDDAACWDTSLCGIPVVGCVDSIRQHPPLPTVIAVGDNRARAAIAARLDLPWLSAVHPRASVDPSVQLGPGVVVFAGAVVQPDCRLGAHAIVNTSASVDHDCQVGDFVHLAPGVHLAGEVSVGEGALVGIGASVTPGVRIGRWTVVGAGAVVPGDLPELVVAAGIPARVRRAVQELPAPEAGEGGAIAAAGGRGQEPRRAEPQEPQASEPPRIYLSPPHMGSRERELLLEAFDSNWIAPLGPHVDAFEREFADKVGAAHAVALSSGTAALHLALQLLNVGLGDRVATSTLTFAASANAIRYVGAEPVFIDSDERSWNMDPQLLAEELEAGVQRGKPLKAVLAVDILGQCADFEAIQPLCRFYDVPLIEDAAEALGATYRGRPAGSFGQIGCFSFNGNKIITTSGGGMLVTARRDWANHARHLATQARDPAPHYEHSEIGYNYRMSNLLAAIGRGQLQMLDERVRRRREIFRFYQQALADLPEITFMSEPQACRSTRWLTCILVDGTAGQVGGRATTREDLRLALARENIESRPVWKPMHLQPVFAGCPVAGGQVSERLFRDGLCLPSGSSLCAADLDRVVAVIRAAFKRPRREAVKPSLAQTVPARGST